MHGCLALIGGTVQDCNWMGNILVFIYNVHRVAAKLARPYKIGNNLVLCIAEGRVGYPYISYLLIPTFGTFQLLRRAPYQLELI